MADLLQQLHSSGTNHHDRFTREGIIRNLGEFLYRLVIVPLVAFLPAALAYGLACLYGDLRYRYDTSTRVQIMHNLKDILGDHLSHAEHARVTQDLFRRHSCEMMDTMRLAGKGRALRRLIEIRGLEHIEAALAAGKGAILCSAHFGSFNAGFNLIGACGFPITTVGNWRSTYDSSMSPMKRLLWQHIFEKQGTHHRRSNIEPMKESFGPAIQIAEVLRSNELIGIPIDAPTTAEARARAISVDFLGAHILLLPGIFEIAQLIGAPVLMMLIHRSPDWRHQVLEISPPVQIDTDAVTVFKRCVKMLEVLIRQDPAYWDWWESRQNLVDLGLFSA